MKVPKKLAAKWEAKLAKEGLGDLEDSKGRLKSWHSFKFQAQFTPDEFAERSTYYYQCEELLRIYTFKRPIERKIWQLHSEGLSVREIAKSINNRLKWSMVARIIKRIKRSNGWKI